MTVIWDKQHETLSREEFRRLQLTRLKAVVSTVYEKVPFYRELFDSAGFTPQQLRSLADLERIPFTTKENLRENFPFKMFAVPLSRVVRIHASSGTTGQPTAVGYTKGDIRVWSDVVARIVCMAGVTRADIAQICFGYGLFTGGFGLHYGLERVGAAVIPASSGNTERQIVLMQQFGTTVLVSTPSYALYMAEVARDMGVDPKSLGLRVGMFGAEPWTEGMRQEIERAWGIRATDNYGLSEVIGPGVSGECEFSRGMHISEDHFLPEVVDPDTGRPVGPGEEGELVLTTLTKQGIPLIRYRTRDITSLDYDPCPCGRTTVRMAKVNGRTDDMLIIRGVNVFPSQIESAIMAVPGVGPHYRIVVDRKDYLDVMEVEVEIAPEAFTGSFRDLEALRDAVAARIQLEAGISAAVKLVEYRTLERTVGKARRVVDLRRSKASAKT